MMIDGRRNGRSLVTIILLSREDDAAVTATAPILKSLTAADCSKTAGMQ